MAAGTALRNRAPSRYAPGKTIDKSMIDMDKTEIVATVAIDILGLKDVLEGTELFPPGMLAKMADPVFAGDGSAMCLTAHRGGVAVGFAYTVAAEITEGT